MRAVLAIVAALLLALPFAWGQGGVVVVVQGTAAPYDKSDITFWFNGEGYDDGTSNNCTSSQIEQSDGAYEMHPQKEFSAGDNTATFNSTGGNIAVTTAAAITGSCGLEFDGGASTYWMDFTVTAEDIIADQAGCMFFEFTRKADETTDGDCGFAGAFDVAGEINVVGYRNQMDDVRTNYDDGPVSCLAVSTADTVDDETTHVAMYRWNNGTSPYGEIYLDGNTAGGTCTSDVGALTITAFFLGSRTHTSCASAGAVAYYVDRVIVSNSEARCTGAGGVHTLYTIAKTATVCGGSGCDDYNDF
jgi:hypothetical protein